MKPNETETTTPETGNGVPPRALPRPRTIKDRQRFAVQEFTNRSGSQSWRVSGYKRNGERIRENFSEVACARARQVELETEYLGTQGETTLRATRLTGEQLSVAEVAVLKLGEDWPSLVTAADYWLSHGKHTHLPESPRLDEAVNAYVQWLETSTLRPASILSARGKITRFRDGMANVRVSDIGPDAIEKYLDARDVSPASRDADRKNISGFFSWCLQRPRHWVAVNPCTAVRVAVPANGKSPEILSVDECKRLMAEAERFANGRLVPYLAVSLFAGLRPTEARRLTWAQVNLADNEIRLEGSQTKTGVSRVVPICPALRAWLTTYKGPFNPTNWQGLFQTLKRRLGYGTPDREHPERKALAKDVLRHTAISHRFRETGSYGLCAEMFGNSESIIKRHYQGRVSSDDTKRFYAILPNRGGKR